MGHLTKYFIFCILFVLSIVRANAQTDVDFWFCIPQLTSQHESDIPALHFSAGELDATVTIDMPNEADFTKTTITVPANTSKTWDFKTYIDGKQESNIIESGLFGESCIVKNKGIHITSTAPITAYLERGKSNNCDIWALKGQNAYGKYFIVPSQNTFKNYPFGGDKAEQPNAWNSIDIVAVEDATVEVTLLDKSLVLNWSSASKTATFKLKKGQTVSLQASNQSASKHLGGTIVKATNGKIAVQWKDDSLYQQSTALGGEEATCSDDIDCIEINNNNNNESSVVVSLPSTGLVKNWPNNTKTATFKLEKNKTIKLEVKNAANLLGGTIVKATGGNVSIKWKKGTSTLQEDNISNNSEGGCYDVIGDQLVPVELAGKEYIIMRGHLGEGNRKAEYVYIMATQANTKIDFSTDENESLASKTLTNVGEITSVCLNSKQINISPLKNYNALYVKSDKPIIVMHMAGFGCEVGGAILPTIIGCTGSTEVSVCRSTSESFFLNIMTKKAHIGDFTVEINGATTTLPSSWFKEVANTGWCYLIRNDTINNVPVDHQNFSSGINGIAISAGTVVKVKNSTGLFHLATINGGASSGCRYGYFSDFSNNEGKAVITNREEDSDYAKFCNGDTLSLVATGGISYSWKYAQGPASGDGEGATFLSDAERSKSTPKVKPPVDYSKYEVTIRKACYTGNDMYKIINLWVAGYPKVNADFEYIQPSKCSPSNVVVTNKSENAKTFEWILDDGTTKSTDTIRDFGKDTLKIENNTNNMVTYTLKLKSSIGENCPETKTKSFSVCPSITADFSATPTKGCQPLDVDFVNNSTGPYTRIFIDYGDGDQTNFTHTPGQTNTQIPSHTYVNKSTKDSVYYATIRIVDEINGGCESEAVVPITVFGIVKAQYIIDKSTSCSPLITRITNYSIGDPTRTTYTWDLPTPTSGTIPAASKTKDSFTLTYENKGTAEIKHKYIGLTATRINSDNTTCVDKLYYRDTLTIYPEFKVDYTISELSGCDPLTTTLTNNSTDRSNDTQFKWYLDDGTTEKSNGTFTHTYYHTLPDIQQYQVKLAGESKYGCRDSIAKNIITVYPYINPNFTIDKVEGCSPLLVTIINNTPSHASKAGQQWNISQPYTVVSGSLNSGQAVLRFENKTGIRQKITITLNDSYNGSCPKTYSKDIEIYPEITASITPDASTVCDSTEITLTNGTKYTGVSTSPTNYSWDFGDGSTYKTTTNTAVKHYYINNTGSTGTTAQKITTTLIASSEYGCADTATTTISVYPKIQAVFSSDNYSICAPDTINIKNESKGASKYVFSFTDGTSDKIKSDLSDVTYHINNTSDMIETKKVTLTASNGTCYSKISKVFYAYPEIRPQLSVSPDAGCGPVDVTISKNGTVGANIFTVDFNDGITDETGNNVIQHTFLNKEGADKTYTVKLTATNQIGCKASTTKTVTAYPEITAAFNYQKDTECSPMNVTLMNSSTNGSKFMWTFGDGSSDETHSDKADFKHAYANKSTDGNSISTYTITMTAMDANHNECKDVTSKEIQIYPKVIASFSTENDEGCSPLTTTFTNKSKGYGLTYNWNYDHDNAQSANTDVTHTHVFDNIEATTHTYNISLITTDVNYCSDTAVLKVKAYPHVIADFSYVKNDVCTPYPVTFSYPESALNGNKFIWDFGFDDNGAVKKDKTPFDFTFDNHTANTVNNYTIKLITQDTTTRCADSTTRTIEVYPQLLPGFTQDVTEGCNPLTVNFTNQTTGLASYLWDFGDSQSSALTSPEHVFKHYETTDQTYNVKLKTTQTATGCEKTVNQDITTYSYVLAKFGINEKDESANGASSRLLGGCTPFAVNITDSSRLNPAGTWHWDFGDGTTSNSRQPSSLTYTNDDNTAPLENKEYTISLVVTNDHGCSNDTAQTIAVYPRSVPDFTGDFQGCEPLTVKFTDKSVVDSKTQYFWTFSDGSTIVDKPPFSKTFHNYSYTDDKEYTVNLKTTTEYNCTDEITKTINVYAKPSASFMPLVDRACPPFEAEFKNNSVGTGLSYTWDFGNGNKLSKSTSKANQKVEYSNDTNEPITFNVELITESSHGCLDTMVNPMITFPNVIVDFSFDTAGCSPHTIEIKNKSTATATEHLWEFGDGSTSVAKEPTFTYYNTTNDDQVLTITYIGSSKYQCTDTIQKQVTVYINPNVDFVAHTPSQRYPDDTVYFENYTQDGPWKYKWDFGDGNTSTTDEKYFMYKYGKWGDNAKDNIFHVTLHIESEHCENTATHDVTILPPYPKIAILNNRPSGCVPLTVDFAIEEEYCNTYEWTFEDGTSSTEAEPTHTFTEPGIYNVKLTAEGDGGSHYDYEIITVYELPQPDFTTSPKFVMLPNQPVQFFNSTKNGNTYIWDFGDGTYSTELNPSHQYTVEGLYDVKLIAYSSQMCTDSILKSEEVEVSGAGYIKYPNAFIPSDESPSDGSYPIPDDMNNVFHPVWFGVKEYDLWIFNRWGEQLFHSTDVNVGWNGRYANEGKELGQDVYFWKAKGKFENNTPFKIAGDVTLIRK